MGQRVLCKAYVALVLLIFTQEVTGQICNVDPMMPQEYYEGTEELSGEELRIALHDIIDDHTVRSYTFIWTAFESTDAKPNGKVWDICSDTPGSTPPYEYEFVVDQGGVADMEGNGFTREHSFPRSWFGGAVSPMNSDIHAVFPCDAYVNGSRSNHPYGEVGQPSFTSMNGSKRGPNSYPGYGGTSFEPIDAYKGDLARAYFYMSTRYMNEDETWPGGPMTDGVNYKEWAKYMLMDWAEMDPVSQKEIDRNNAIFAIQGNRNPFIDCPGFIDLVWGDIASSVTDRVVAEARNIIFPNPISNAEISVNMEPDEAIILYDYTGKVLMSCSRECVAQTQHTVATIPPGLYIISVRKADQLFTQKLVK